jgi:deoxyribodipyrimidine photo-lyase
VRKQLVWFKRDLERVIAMQDRYGCAIGKDYPTPIVDHKQAVAAAKRRISAVRKTDAARAEAERIYARHGSRKRPGRRRTTSRAG